MGLPTPANRIVLGAEASRCGSQLARIVSHSWDSGRLLYGVDDYPVLSLFSVDPFCRSLPPTEIRLLGGAY
jgi:hypothetical protein